MENNNIATEILSRVRTGAKKAFLLSKQGQRSDLCFGATVVEKVEFLIWLKTPNFEQILTHQDADDGPVEFIFDGYGPDPACVRFALVQDGQIILDSAMTPVVGIFSIHTSMEHKFPLSILGLIVHAGDDPVSIFLADRSTDLIVFSAALAEVVKLLGEGADDERLC